MNATVHVAIDRALLHQYEAGLSRPPPAPPADAWAYSVTGEGRHVCDAEGRALALIVGGANWREADALGDLMAAAPTLLAALDDLIGAVEGRWRDTELGEDVRAALAGARAAGR